MTGIVRRIICAGLIVGIFSGSFAQAAVNIINLNAVYTQDFNTLPSSGTNLTWVNNSTISGWHRNYTGTTPEPGRDLSLQADTINASGVSTQIGFINTGVSNSTDRSVTLRAVSYVTNLAVGAVFRNNAGSAATGFSIGYTGEQWRRATAVACSLYFEYAVVASINEATLDIQADNLGWTRVSALEFVSPNLGSGSGLNGSKALFQTNFSPVTISAAITDGQYLVMRWLVTDSVNNHALGIDDVQLSFQAVAESLKGLIILK
jgi:hypothetical protein